MQRNRERVGRHHRRVAEQDGELLRTAVDGLRLRLANRVPERRLLLADPEHSARGGDLEHRLVGRDDPRVPSRDLNGGVDHILQHRERQGTAFQRRERIGKAGLRLIEGRNGDGDDLHAGFSLAEVPR